MRTIKTCIAAVLCAVGITAFADTVAQFIKGGEVVAEFETAEAAVAALDDAQYADIEEFRIGLTADTEFDFGGRTNRVVIGNVGAVTNTLKNVLLDCAGDCAVTGMVGKVVFGEGVRIEKSALGFKQGWVDLIIKGGLYKNDPIGYCEDGYLSARRYDENAALNGLYAVLPEAEIAVEDRKEHTSTRYATLQDAFNLIGENKEVTLRLFNNLELGTAVAKLEGNKVIHLLPGESGANTIKRVGVEPVIEIGRGAKLEIKNVIFDGANVTSKKPMIEVAGKAGRDFGWLIAGGGFVVSNAVGGAVHVGNGGKFELDGVAKIIDNTTDGKPKNVIIEDSAAIQLTACGAVTDGNYAQIGVSSDNDKFMIPGGQFGQVSLDYEYATSFADGDISVAEPKVGFINDRDGTLYHAAGAKIAAAGKKTYKRWVGGEYKVTLEEGDYLVSRVSTFPTGTGYLPELIWTARQEAPAAKPAPAVLDWTDTTLTLAVSNGCDYALVTSGSAETNWVSMVGTDNTYAFARPAGDIICLKRYSITPSNIVSAAAAYNVKIPAGTKDDPWTVGAGVTAWTNGTEFVIGGEGTVPDLTKLAGKVAVDKLAIAAATVTGAESEAFKAFSNVALTLPDGWQGELPDEDGNWYGATVNLMGIPLTVKNVTFRQRYPWNGLVDVGFTLTGPAGETNVVVTVCTNGTKIADFTAAVTIPEGGVLATNFVWDAMTAGLATDFTSDDVTVEVAFAGGSPEPVADGVQLWENGPYFATCNVGAEKPADYGILTNFGNAAQAVTDAMGDGWRLPTQGELEKLIDDSYCTRSWDGDRKVLIFTGKGDYAANGICLPAAGYKDDGEFKKLGAYGRYWTSSTYGSYDAYRLHFEGGGSIWVSSDARVYHLSLRAVRDTPPVTVSAVSAEGFLDLTVGDRVAADEEALVVDPAWGEATSAKVMIDGESSARTYASASIDTWETTALEPGRYALALSAGDDNETAAFWKLGDDWVVFDSSNITADVTFEADKTYLFFGTNTVSGATLTVQDGAKFFYDEGAPAGFKAASVAELPKRYEIADGVDPADESKLFQIVEKLRGSEDNPWDIGEGVTAYTNGTEIVIGGEGTVEDLSEIPSAVKDDIKAITIADATVTGAAEDVFAGVNNVDLTLPDNWQGELPKDGSWYGATGVTLTAMPLTVKNVTFQQRYPWNGLVDINFNLTGEGMVNVAALVTTNGVALANPTVTGETVFDLGGGKELKNFKLVWDAKADLPANFTCDDVVIVVTAGRQKTDGDYMVIDLSADGNGRFAVSYEDMDVASAIEKYNTDEYKTGKLVLKKIPAGTAYPCHPGSVGTDPDPTPITRTMTPAKDYFIGLFETTAAQYDRVMGVETPSDATTPKNYISYNMIRGGDDSPDIEPTDPVTAESFMGILVAKTGVAGFDLPTEIQWEIAARAGMATEYGSYLDEAGNAVVGTYDSSAAPWGNTTNFMWFAKNNNPEAGLKSVGRLRPNPWGLYDTLGNAYEICLDWYNGDITSWADVETPVSETDEYDRCVERGGYFSKAATVARPSIRSKGYTDDRGNNIGVGFRLCRTVATAGSSTSATATSISEAFAVDLREEIALAEGETTVSNVTWSATLWGELDDEFVTAIGWTNLTTGATGVFSNLAGVVGDAAEDANLPKKDGEYVLTHSTGDLKSFVTFVVSGYPLGSEGNPWLVGNGVTAYLDTNGTLHIEGDGAMKDFTETDPAPWAGVASDIKAIEVAKGVTKIGNAAFAALDYNATTKALTFQGEDHVLNLLAFVSADGSKTNAPLAKAFSVYKDSSGTVEPIVTFQTPDQVYVYTKAPTLMRYGYDEVLLLTLPDLKAVQTAELIETAGETPYSKTMQGLLDEALDKIDKATNYDEVMDGYVERWNQIKAQAEKEKPQPIGDSDVTWKIVDGVLVIEGEGEMPDFDEANPAPWDEFADEITEISVGEEVGRLGDAAFFACNGATSITLANEEGVVNLAAFVSADGLETSFPENIYIIEDGEKAKAVRFEGDADEDYDSLDAAYAAGETDVAPLTLNNVKAGYVEGLEEIAGPAPRSEEMQQLLNEAIDAVLAATTAAEVDAAAEDKGFPVSVLSAKEAVEKAAGDPAKRSKELQAAVDEALAAIDAAKTFEEVASVRAEALAAINELVGKLGELYPNGDGGVFVTPVKATAYEGVVLDASGAVSGTINVKLSKPSKKGVTKLTATVKLLSDGKSLSFKRKDVPANVNGPLVVALNPSNKKSYGHTLAIAIEGDSLTGTFDDGSIDAACNVFKRKGDPKRDAVKPIAGVWTGAFTCDAGEIYFSAKLRKSGSASVKVVLPNGKKASVSSKIEVGDNVVAVPVTVSKVVKGVTMTFGFRLAFVAGVDADTINVTPLETRDKSKTVLSSDAAELLAVGMQKVTSKEFKTYQVAVDPALETALGPITKNNLRLASASGWISGSLKFGKVSGNASGVVVNGAGIGKVSVKINRVKYDYQFVVAP